ncbi:TPA: hypothetical protein ACG5T8_005044, partial [Escherichia coli]
ARSTGLIFQILILNHAQINGRHARFTGLQELLNDVCEQTRLWHGKRLSERYRHGRCYPQALIIRKRGPLPKHDVLKRRHLHNDRKNTKIMIQLKELMCIKCLTSLGKHFHGWEKT